MSRSSQKSQHDKDRRAAAKKKPRHGRRERGHKIVPFDLNKTHHKRERGEGSVFETDHRGKGGPANTPTPTAQHGTTKRIKKTTRQSKKKAVKVAIISFFFLCPPFFIFYFIFFRGKSSLSFVYSFIRSFLQSFSHARPSVASFPYFTSFSFPSPHTPPPPPAAPAPAPAARPPPTAGSPRCPWGG